MKINPIINTFNTQFNREITNYSDHQALEDLTKAANMQVQFDDMAHVEQVMNSNHQLADTLSHLNPRILSCSNEKIIYRYGIALSLAIFLQDQSKAIFFAETLIKLSHDNTQNKHFIEINGVYVPRSDIESIAQGHLPKKIEQLRLLHQHQQNIHLDWLEIQQGWQANVHMNGLISKGTLTLKKIQKYNSQNNIPKNVKFHETYENINSVIAKNNNAIKAIEGLNFAITQNEFIHENALKTNIEEVIKHLWFYISFQKNEQLKENLITSFCQRLIEIHEDQPCNVGCVQRLLQTVDGIDPLFNNEMPNIEELKNEINSMVALLNELLDEKIDQNFNEMSQLIPHSSDTSKMNTSEIESSIEEIILIKQQIIKNSIIKSFVHHRELPENLIKSVMHDALNYIETNELMLADKQLADLSIEYRNHNGESVLSRAWQQQDYDTLRKQILKGASIIEIDDNGISPLITAIHMSDLNLVQLLCLDKNIIEIIHQKNTRINQTPFMIAAINGNHLIISEFINVGANIHQTDDNGDTALIWATENQRTQVVETLIKAGANVNESNHFGDSALLIAANKGDTHLVEQFILANVNVNQSNQNNVTALMLAAAKGHFQIAQTLLEAGADVNKIDQFETTALKIAAKNGHLPIVKILLQYNAQPDYLGGDVYGETALLLAAKYGHTNIMVELIKVGANPNLTNHLGDSALMLAAADGNIEIVNLLINAGANVNAVGEDRVTALLLATMGRHTDVVQRLIEAGVDINQTNYNNETPLNLALKMGFDDVADLLKTASNQLNN